MAKTKTLSNDAITPIAAVNDNKKVSKLTIEGTTYEIKLPYSVTFTGASTETFDGSGPLTVQIPNLNDANKVTQKASSSVPEGVYPLILSNSTSSAEETATVNKSLMTYNSSTMLLDNVVIDEGSID